MSTINLKSKNNIFSASVVAFSAWFAIIFQLCLTDGSVTNFLSYFTILSNLLLALSITAFTFLPNTKIGAFFSNNSIQASIVLYISIVALIYNLILRGIWKVTGWQLIVDNMLHVLNPILYILYWFVFAEKRKLKWKDGLLYMIFPMIYLIYSLIRGAIVNWYPYPFLNANTLGYKSVSINVLGVIIAFFITAQILIFVNNKTSKKAQNR